ncbi:MAG TPA: carotenoid biosynthesis protein [Saprospirales bacterium]|nr:carotenoid biosynthesis protein [Saprospirales bacterium]HAY70687.1 carotenoid biosynthesis protein [Saprospirales bacterium]HRQ29410.1 carotenoid biosynthesis protein [Saprospiraceae bacterium]
MSKSLNQLKNSKYRLSLFLLLVIYLVGIVTALLGHTDSLMRLTPFNLVFAAALIVYNSESLNVKYILWFTLIAVSGFLIEYAGITTGAIFGLYHYGNTLGLKVLEVPLIIGINWSVLVFSTAAILANIKISLWFKSMIAATLMLIYDFFLEPVAVRFDFWTWEGGNIPIQNYLAWWMISFIFLVPTHMIVKRLNNRMALPVILIQALFFIVLILKEGLLPIK